MKLDISMAVLSLHNQPLHIRQIEGLAFIRRLCASIHTPAILTRQSQQGHKVCTRSPLAVCFNKKASEMALADSDHANNKSQVELTGLSTLQQSMQLDMISNENILQNRDLLNMNLKALKAADVDGLMVDVWWGIVEAEGPKKYDWSAYRDLFKLIQRQDFKLQAIMSFHQCGGNVGDNINIPLPKWVLKAGISNPNIFFTNKNGQRNKECLTYGVDDQPVLQGRTAIEVYSDFMKSFRENMSDFWDSGVITEIEVGLGPAGELRYPSYPESQGWKFPGIGEFQCYDEYLLSELRAAAENIGRPEWGLLTPDNAGHYNDQPSSTGFSRNHGTYRTDCGKFFLTWYSTVLLRHGDKILEVASEIFEGCAIKLAAKVAGIHWWYKSRNHAAELTSGHYNLEERDGYRPIGRMLARHRAVLNFTCIEMQDEEQPSEAGCGPEALVRQVLSAGWKEGIEVSCENALHRYDREGYNQMIKQARPDGISRERPPKRRISALTYLRLSEKLMEDDHFKEFKRFVRRMHVGLPEKYFNPRVPLQRSKPRQEMKEFLSAAIPRQPLSYGVGDSTSGLDAILEQVSRDEDSSKTDESPFLHKILRRLLSPFSWFQGSK